MLAKTESFGAVYQSMCLTVCMQFAVVYISRAGNLLPGKRQKLWKEATEWFVIRLCIVDGHIACMKNQVDVVTFPHGGRSPGARWRCKVNCKNLIVKKLKCKSSIANTRLQKLDLQKLDCKKINLQNLIAKKSICKTWLQKLDCKKTQFAKTRLQTLHCNNLIMKKDREQKLDNNFENRCDCSRLIFVHNKPPSCRALWYL